jgi:hypothetical protein
MDQRKRSALLEALCILSFAGNGIAIFIYLIATVFNQPARRWIREWSSMYDVSRYTSVYFLLFTLLYCISFLGVLRMWRLKTSGLMLYIISQTTILFLPTIWMKKPVFPSVVIIFTILFMLLYIREFLRIRRHSLEP